jgi:CHAT domain
MNTVRIRVVARQDGGYSVQLFSDVEHKSSKPEVSADIPADLAVATAPDVLRNGAVDEAVQRFVRDNPSSAEFGPIGEYLASLLLRGRVGERWKSLRQEHPEGFRTLLEIEPPNLRLIPWELMSLNEQRLFINPIFVFARAERLEADATAAVTPELVPLRLLVVEGDSDKELKTTDEIRGIKSALRDFLGGIDAEFLCGPTASQLQEAFTRVRPHIFHFVGHGTEDPVTRQPALKLPGWLLTRQYILDLLSPIPRVAVLNACRSSDVVGLRALTEAFLNRRADAVIGMQGNVHGQAAATFGSTLYCALAQGEPLDQAVAIARRAVYTLVGVTNQERDWCMPSLTLRIQPEQLLPLKYGISDEDRKRVEERLFPKVEFFVDRTEQRWKLASAVDPDGGQPQRVLRIVGDMEVGKTSLVQWIRTRCALRGSRIRYVDFEGKNLNFVNILCVIRDTPDDVPSLEPAAVHAFDRFNYDLGYLANGQLPEEPAGNLPQTAPEVPAELQLGGDNGERILDSFRSALAAATAGHPLALILDHIGGVLKNDFRTWIYPYMIRKLIDGELPNLRLIVVMSGEQQSDYWPADEIKLASEVKVDLISPEDYVTCAEDIVLAMGVALSKYEPLISALKDIDAPSAWSPVKLKTLREVVAGAR